MVRLPSALTTTSMLVRALLNRPAAIARPFARPAPAELPAVTSSSAISVSSIGFAWAGVHASAARHAAVSTVARQDRIAVGLF